MRTVIESSDAPKAIGPYSQAIRAGNLLFCSGQIPLDPKTGALIPSSDIRLETQRVMENLRAVLHAGGSALANVVKTTIFVVDLGDFAAINEEYAKHFEGAPPPARSTVQVAALPRGARVEIEMTALVRGA